MNMIPDWAKELNCSITVCDKDGVHKMIFQSAWKENGIVAGLCEISMIIPADLPHFVRG